MAAAERRDLRKKQKQVRELKKTLKRKDLGLATRSIQQNNVQAMSIVPLKGPAAQEDCRQVLPLSIEITGVRLGGRDRDLRWG
jgi:hypothetical protein